MIGTRAVRAARAALARRGVPGARVTPQRLLDLLLRTGADGDLFGLRPRGWSIAKLRKKPHGVVLADSIATGVLRRRRSARRAGGSSWRRSRSPSEIERMSASTDPGLDPDFPLRLIGLRELRSHNSWMHNAPLLMRGGRVQALRVHPDDAEAHGLVDGEDARITSKSGAIEVPVKVTDEMKPGTVAVPHGWGHRGGGWQVANAHARRERQRAGERRSGGPRAARRDGVPQRDRGAASSPSPSAPTPRATRPPFPASWAARTRTSVPSPLDSIASSPPTTVARSRMLARPRWPGWRGPAG